MSRMLVLQATIFILMALGFFFKKKKIISREGQKNITDLVIYLILPCNIITSFLSELPGDAMAAALQILLISLVIQIIAVIYGKVLFAREGEDRKKCLRYGIICSNAGFLGSPVAEGIFGAGGLMLASVFLIPVRTMMWSEGIAIFTKETDIRATVKKVATHPCIIACVIGMLLMLTGAQVPAVILTPVQTIGRCNLAMSMMVIGMILAEIDPRTLWDPVVGIYTLHRLIIIPALVMLALHFLPVDPTVKGVSILLTAMPAGSTTSMLAAKYDVDPQFATKMVVFSTLLSIPAILIWSIILV